jgi:hypothetical protein
MGGETEVADGGRAREEADGDRAVKEEGREREREGELGLESKRVVGDLASAIRASAPPTPPIPSPRLLWLDPTLLLPLRPLRALEPRSLSLPPPPPRRTEMRRSTSGCA